MRKSYKYNLTRLRELDIKLVNEYNDPDPKLSKTSIIEGYCKTPNCTNTFSKSFRVILLESGPYCTICTRNNNSKDKEEAVKIEWNYELLKDLDIELLEDYSNTKLSRNSTIKGCCKTETCENHFQKKFESIILGGGPFCEKCTEIKRRNKIGETFESNSKWTFNMLEELNVVLLEDYSKNSLTRESIIKGFCKNENCSSTFEKTFGTIIRHGGPYCSKCTDINLREKMKETSFERYGVENPFQADLVKDKITKTNLEKYGVEKASQTQEVQEKMKQTCIKKYGTEWASQTKEIQEKMKQTCIEKYGVEWVSQVKEIHEKQQKNGYTFKDYKFPSGKVIRVQGFEPLALDILLETVSEEDILTGYTKVPVVWYEMDSKKHRYYTDIFIPSQNKCIEVKSDFTFYKEMEQNLLKQEATKLLGFECEIWIFDKNKKLIEILI